MAITAPVSETVSGPPAVVTCAMYFTGGPVVIAHTLPLAVVIVSIAGLGDGPNHVVSGASGSFFWMASGIVKVSFGIRYTVSMSRVRSSVRDTMTSADPGFAPAACAVITASPLPTPWIVPSASIVAAVSASTVQVMGPGF